MSKTKHFMVLDGLRGVAALAVVCLHTSEEIGFGPLPAHGYLAVDFFFMLSGVVMASAYGEKLCDGRMGFLAIRQGAGNPALPVDCSGYALWYGQHVRPRP